MAKVHYIRVVDSGKQTPSAPPGFTATAVSTSSITLTWGAVPTATSYTVRRFGTTIATGVTALTYTDLGLPPSTLETYTVSAVNIYGEGPQSAPASATTFAGGGSLTISTSSLPNATVGGSYFYQMAASGGTPPYQWGQNNGTYFGGFNYSVNVPVSAITQTTNAVFTLTSSASTNPFAGQTQVMVYPIIGSWPKSLYTSGSITSVGGSSGAWTVTTNIDFSNTSYVGNLLNCALAAGPTGVNPYQMTLTGMLEVVPSVAETASLPIIVTDNVGATATATLTLTSNTTLKIMGCSLDLTTQPLPSAMVGNSYSHQMLCAGGSGTGQTWSQTGLSSGLTMSTAGVITGIPTTAGTGSITVTVTDSVGPPVSHAFSMVVAATANVARPSYNTGTGFFTVNGKVYDPNGDAFRIRGMNQNHFDATGTPAAAQAYGCNTVRMFMYLNGIQGYTAASYVPAVNRIISGNMLPVLTLAVVPALGIVNPTITGTAGQFSCAASTLPILVGSVVQVEGTNTGSGSISGYSNGVSYLVSATNGSTTFTLTTSGGGPLTTVAGTTAGLQWGGTTNTSGNGSAADLQTCANWFAANYTSFSPLAALNVNEWNGATGIWQSNYETFVSTVRAAGCTNLLVFDANGDGQNYQTITTLAAAVQASDPQQNCIFSFHAYGATQNIQAQISSITKGSSTTVVGINFVGPYSPLANFEMGVFPSGITGTPPIFINGVSGMTQINGFTSASNAVSGGTSGAYTISFPLNSSSYSNYTSGGTIYSSVHIGQIIAPALAALASSNVCCIIGEIGPGKNIGTTGGSPTSCTNSQVIAAAEANGLGWMYWAADDSNLQTSENCQNWYGAQRQNSNTGAVSNLTYVGLDAAYNPITGTYALAAPASYFIAPAITTTVPNIATLSSTYPSSSPSAYTAQNVLAMAANTKFTDAVTGITMWKITASGTPGSSQYCPWYSNLGLAISQPWGTNLDQYHIAFADVNGPGWVCDFGPSWSSNPVGAYNFRALPSINGSATGTSAPFSRMAGNPHIMYILSTSGNLRLYNVSTGVYLDATAGAPAAAGYSSSWPVGGWPWTTAISQWLMINAQETFATANNGNTGDSIVYTLNLSNGTAATITKAALGGSLDDLYVGYGEPTTNNCFSGDVPPGNAYSYNLDTSTLIPANPTLTTSNWVGFNGFSHQASLNGYWTALESNKGGGTMQILKLRGDGTNNANSNILWSKYWGQYHMCGHWWNQGSGINQYMLISMDWNASGNSSLPSGWASTENYALSFVNPDTGNTHRLGFHYSVCGQSSGNVAAGSGIGFSSGPGGASQYYSQAHASISHDGKLVIYGSNMGNQARVDLFVAEVPLIAGTPGAFP